MPAPERKPPTVLEQIVGLVVIAAVAIFIVHVVISASHVTWGGHASEPTNTDTCIVNGLGNELCGDAAVAYCTGRMDQGGLDDSSLAVCDDTVDIP